MDNLGHGLYTPMETYLLPPLHLIYAENPSDSGKVSISFVWGIRKVDFFQGVTLE